MILSRECKAELPGLLATLQTCSSLWKSPEMSNTEGVVSVHRIPVNIEACFKGKQKYNRIAEELGGALCPLYSFSLASPGTPVTSDSPVVLFAQFIWQTFTDQPPLFQMLGQHPETETSLSPPKGLCSVERSLVKGEGRQC